MTRWFIIIGWISFTIEAIAAIVIAYRVSNNFSIPFLALAIWLIVVAAADLFTLLEAD